MVVASASSCVQKEKARVLKLAHTLPTDHPVHQSMDFMAKRVKELSGEKMQVKIYPSGQLGTEQQCVEILQLGGLAMTKISAAVMEGFSDHYKVLGVPYIFENKEHAYRVQDGEIGQDILLSTEEQWIRGLCFLDAGSRSFYTIDKPIRTPEDLEGMKIRVMKSKTSMDMVKALGGSPTPIAFSELYTALQNGVVDGAENNPPSLYTSKHYEVCKYYSLDEHTSVPDVFIISTKVWESLNEDEKKWLSRAVEEMVLEQRKLWAMAVEKSMEEVTKAGVEIIYPDKAPFREKVKPLHESYKNNEIIYSYIKRISATR